MTQRRIVATVEARMTSTRLPGKVIAPILGRPMLSVLIERLRRARTVDRIVIATTTNREDDVLERLAGELGVGCFRGSEDDVLDRVLRAARAAQGDVVVEITGDCPLVDPEIVDRVVDAYLADNRIDYASNTLQRTYPRGLDVQVFSLAVLEAAARATKDPTDREHVSLFIYQHPERFVLHNVESRLPVRFADARLTVDTAEDLALIRTIFERLSPRVPEFTLQHVLDLLDDNPQLLHLNRHVVQRQPAAAKGLGR